MQNFPQLDNDNNTVCVSLTAPRDRYRFESGHCRFLAVVFLTNSVTPTFQADTCATNVDLSALELIFTVERIRQNCLISEVWPLDTNECVTALFACRLRYLP